MFRITVLSILLGLSCKAEKIDLAIEEITNPSQHSSGESNLVQHGDGLVLSWIHERDSIDVLYASHYVNDSFQSPIEISRNSDWFVNWADFPGIASFEDGKHLLSYWLQMRDVGTYDYDIHISLSADNGKSWTASTVLHDDAVSAEHGFVSATAVENGIMLIWLDGREMTKGDSHDGEHSHGSGAMTLRSAVVNQNGEILNRQQIDNRVCECCQTDIVNTDCGQIAVYRNRSNHEVRDIYYARYFNEAWTDPRPLHLDNWKINGCPVNGPRIAAHKNIVVAAWFTQSENEAKVQFKISTDCGATFNDVKVVGKGENIMGRIDVELKEDHIFISHMESNEIDADIILSDYSLTGTLIRRQTIAKNGLSRKSGFPRMAVLQDHLYISFRDLNSDRIKTLKII